LEEDGLLEMDVTEFRSSLKSVQYKVDLTTTSAVFSRWNHLSGDKPLNYFTFESNNVLRYISHPIQQNIKITGSPLVSLEFTCDKRDAVIFVYLSEVDASTKHYYVTEGMLRAIHRREHSDESRSDIPGVPYRSYKRENSKQLKKNGQTTINIYLQPISYMFKKGNRIAVQFTGADVGNFDNNKMTDFFEPTQWRVYCNSKLVLPVVETKTLTSSSSKSKKS